MGIFAQTAKYVLHSIFEAFLNVATNWLQVLGSTKLSQINESEGHQFEPKMSNLESLKT